MENKKLQDTNILLEKETEDELEFDKQNWAKVYQYSDNPDKVIDDFIDAFLKRNDISELGFEDALKDQMKNFGAPALSAANPFLKWILIYRDLHGADMLAKFDDEQYQTLDKLYAERVINDADLAGTGRLGRNTLIFVKDLFYKFYDDAKYLTQLYYWLSVPANAEKVANLLDQADGKELYDILQILEYPRPADATGVNLNNQSWRTIFGKAVEGGFENSDLKNFLAFTGFEFNPEGKLRNARAVYSAMEKIDNLKSKSQSAEPIERSDDLDDIKKVEVSDTTKEILKDRGMTDVSKAQAKEIISYLLNDVIKG